AGGRGAAAPTGRSSPPGGGQTIRSNRSGSRQTRLPIAPAPSEVPTATVAPNASATVSRSRAKSSNRKAFGSAGELERPCPRKSNRTLVPATSGVNAASSLRLFVSPCANTVTGSPSPSTSQNNVASSPRTSGTDPTYRRPGRTMRRDGRHHRDAQSGPGPDAVTRLRVRAAQRAPPPAPRPHAPRGRSRAARGGASAGGVRPRLPRVPARPRAEGVDPFVV